MYEEPSSIRRGSRIDLLVSDRHLTMCGECGRIWMADSICHRTHLEEMIGGT